MTDLAPVADEVTPEQHKRLRWALVLISLAQLMVVLDSTIANIALPYIGTDLDIDQANLSWIVTGYALTFGGFLLLGGRLADLYGRRRIFMVGVVVFAVASLIGGTAQSEVLLLAARALQGMGAALASPAALALITTTFPAGRERNRAFAVYAAMAGIGAAVGLILGGWLTGLDSPLGIAGWRYLVLPFPTLDSLAIPPVPPPPARDWRGQGERWAAQIRDNGWHRDETLSLKRLAALLGTNESYVSRALNDGLGVGFSDFVNGLRCEDVAAALVADERRGVLSIAFDAGFASKASFNRAFQRRYGQSPSAYRAAQKA